MSDAGLFTPDKDARIAELEAALAAAHADISARDILIDTLRVQIARLKRMQFGKSSEKLDTQIAQLELALEELEGEAIVAAVRRGDPVAVIRPSPVRALPAHLPRDGPTWLLVLPSLLCAPDHSKDAQRAPRASAAVDAHPVAA